MNLISNSLRLSSTPPNTQVFFVSQGRSSLGMLLIQYKYRQNVGFSPSKKDSHSILNHLYYLMFIMLHALFYIKLTNACNTCAVLKVI